METIVVERSFEEPADLEQLQATEDGFGWCLGQNRVRFLRTYLSSDRKRMVCIYEAPDAEAVRKVNRRTGLPFDRIWTASTHGPEA